MMGVHRPQVGFNESLGQRFKWERYTKPRKMIIEIGKRVLERFYV